MRRYLVGSWMEPGHQKDQAVIRSLQLTPSSRKGKGAGHGVNNQPCLHAEASIKIPIVCDSESFQVADT